MFTKLRNRFLLLNLVIISVMMLIAFASIYFIIYRTVSSEVNMELHRVSEQYQMPGKKSGPDRRDIKNDQPGPEGTTYAKPEPSISFYLTADSQWNITAYTSMFATDNEFYESAKKAALSQNREFGDFKLDGNHWAYIISPVRGGYSIVFLDITSRQGILTNLIYAFLIVALVMLFFIYFVSRFFANKSIKPVKEAFDKQKQFIADASHELKTPLAVINTNVDVLLSNGEDTVNNQSKWLNYIKSESERMTKLTNDLLYLTQVDYSDVKMIFADFNLSDAVENVILTMEAVIFEHSISLNYDIEPNLMANGNNEQIKEVVMILLDNALKYTNAQGSVGLALKKHHNDVVLTVTNTGEGISEDNLDIIFDRFYRTDKSRARKSGGYGLGLAIAKAIITQHKGKIYAKSTKNEKTTFYVELPGVSS